MAKKKTYTRVSSFSGKPVSSLKKSGSSAPQKTTVVKKTMNPPGPDARSAQAIRQNKRTPRGRTN